MSRRIYTNSAFWVLLILCLIIAIIGYGCFMAIFTEIQNAREQADSEGSANPWTMRSIGFIGGTIFGATMGFVVVSSPRKRH